MTLPDLFLEIGYLATGSVEIVDRLLSLQRNVSVVDIAKLITIFVSTHTNHPSRIAPGDLYRLTGVDVREVNMPTTWNVTNLLISALNQNLDCSLESLLVHLDNPEFEIRDYPAVNIIVQMVSFFVKNPLEFPIQSVTRKWKNPRAQFSFLITLIRFLPQALSNITRPCISLDQQSSKNIPPNMLKSPWMNLDLIQAFVGLVKTEIGQEVLAFLESSCAQSPECMLLGLAQCKIDDVQGLYELGLKLTQIFVLNHLSSTFILSRAWIFNQSLLIGGLIRAYLADPHSLSRILDITQELKILPKVLETKPYSFAIDLATLASRRDYLNLEKWLQDHIRSIGVEFVQHTLQYLREKISVLMTQAEKPMGMKIPTILSPESCTTFLKTLSAHQMMLAPEQIELLGQLSAAAAQVFAKGPGDENGLMMGAQQQQQAQASGFLPEIEEEASRYFEKLYKGEVSVLDVISALKKCQTSANLRDQELFKCIIKNLFDEYKFYPSYPEKSLAITSILFGSIIQHEVVTGNALGIALRGVLDALRQPPGTPMNKFGSQALLQFQSRLSEWPQFTTMLLQIDHLRLTNPEVAMYLERQRGGAQTDVVPGRNMTPSNLPTPPQPAATPAVGISENVSKEVFPAVQVFEIHGLPEETIPEDKTQDKILFTVNNISEENMDAKSSEMQNIMLMEYHQWFSKYLVDKRVCIEPNFHVLYVTLLDKLKSADLENLILRETYSKIKTIIESEKTVSSSSERTLLKNLGMWLGSLTLAKNKPIKFTHISFKDLLLQGYDAGRLIVVIPFVCKVLEQTKSSKIFKSQNPWLMAIMKLLSELYHYAELKLNLKFEIEVLCKNIQLDIKEIDPSGLLKNRGPSAKVEQPMQRLRLDDSLEANQMESSEALALLASLPSLIIFNPNIPVISANPAMRRLVTLSFERAVREILAPVVERSVTIAGIAARELTLKDFALEPDENILRKAGHILAASLAGSLASVTCREPLRISIIQQLRTVLLQNGYNEQTLPDQAIFMIVSDNLDVACSIIQKTAAENATVEIDEALAPAFVTRKKHRERTGQPYFDMNVYSSLRYPQSFPDVLRLKTTGVSPNQMRIYEEFLRLPEYLERSRGSMMRPEMKADTMMPHGQEDVAVIPIPACIEKLNAVLVEIENVLGKKEDTSDPEFQQPLQNYARQVHQIIMGSVSRDDVSLLFAQMLVGLLYKNERKVLEEAHIELLSKVCEISRKTGREIGLWFLYSQDERKHNVAVFMHVSNLGIVSSVDLDMYFARMLETGDKSATGFAADFLLAYVEATSTDLIFLDFFLTVATLKNSSETVESVHQLLSLVQKQEALPIDRKNPEELRKEMENVFRVWMRIRTHPNTTENYEMLFVQQLIQKGILQGDDTASLFLRICIEVSIKDCFEKYGVTSVPHSIVYQGIDALSKLIVLIILQLQDNVKINLVTKVLSISLLILVNEHEQKKNSFNQKPFFRLFSGLLSNFHDHESSLKNIFFQILSAISNTFHTLQPSFLPAFSFSWLQLVSHRFFMPKLLQFENQKGWPYFQRLLVDLFKFMGSFLIKDEFSDSVRHLYRGTLRVLLVLLHDFPEFLCSYHLSLMDVIPASCIQIRNLILSAFPAGMRLPDPFTPNLKFDLLPDINNSPQIHSDYVSILTANQMKNDLDQYMKNRAPSSFLTELPVKLMLPQMELESKYNVPLINALVVYCGLTAIAHHQGKAGVTPNGTIPTAIITNGLTPTNPHVPIANIQITNSAAMDVFMHLVTNFDNEGRYLVLSAMANQLRYPNSHTYFFSCMMLQIFVESTTEIVQEQVTRVMLERLVVNRPHPYGTLITFIELIRNPKYKFWEHTDIIRCAPEIERLFTQVAKSVNSSFSG